MSYQPVLGPFKYPLVLVLLSVIVVPNVAFWIVSSYLGVFRPYVNADYLLVALLFVGRFKFLGWGFLVGLFFIDVLGIVGQIFPLVRVSDAVYLLGFLDVAPLQYKLVILFAFFMLLLMGWFFRYLSREESKAPTVLVVNALVLLFGLSFFFDAPPENKKNVWRMSGFPYIGSQAQNNWLAYNKGIVRRIRSEEGALVPTKVQAASAAWHEAPEYLPHKLVLIVAESWGATRADIHNVVISPILNLKDRFSTFETGTAAFSGATVEGELKELCRLATSEFGFSDTTSGFEHCLPNRLKELGYHSVGIHGASGVMYDRAAWYPKAGFDETIFFESRNWSRRCYSFPGACDFEIAPEVGKVLGSHDKTFVYWLTLNSHSLYDERDIVIDALDCESVGVPIDTQTCRNLKLHAQFFTVLADLVQAPDLAGSEVLVVGDHVPPIFDQEEKNTFFEIGKVPWIRFKIPEANDIAGAGPRSPEPPSTDIGQLSNASLERQESDEGL